MRAWICCVSCNRCSETGLTLISQTHSFFCTNLCRKTCKQIFVTLNVCCVSYRNFFQFLWKHFTQLHGEKTNSLALFSRCHVFQLLWINVLFSKIFEILLHVCFIWQTQHFCLLLLRCQTLKCVSHLHILRNLHRCFEFEFFLIESWCCFLGQGDYIVRTLLLIECTKDRCKCLMG